MQNRTIEFFIITIMRFGTGFKMDKWEQQKFKSSSKPGRLRLWGAIYIYLLVAACAPRPFPRLQDLANQPWQKSQVDWVKMREELLKQHQKGVDSMKK